MSRIITAPDMTVVRGRTYRIPIYARNLTGQEVACSMSVIFHPGVFQYVRTELGPGVPTDSVLAVNDLLKDSGAIGFEVDSMNHDAVTPGKPNVLVYLVLRVIDNPANRGGNYPITFSSRPTATSFSDDYGNLLDWRFIDPHVTVI